MADNDIRLKVSAELRGLTELNDKFKVLATAMKQADLLARSSKEGMGALAQNIKFVEQEARKLNLTYQQEIALSSQIYQVNQRNTVGFKSLATSLHEQTQASNRSQQGFVALAYILQDLPYGIRGVANNITQLSQVLGTPIWINLAISGLTSLAVVFDRQLKAAITGVNSELDAFNQKSSEAGRKFSSYGYGLESRASYQIGGFGTKKLTSERGYTLTQAAFVEEQIIKYEKLRDTIKDKIDASDEEKKQLKGYEASLVNLNHQLDSQLAYIRAINSEFERRAKATEKSALAEEKLLYNIIKFNVAQRERLRSNQYGIQNKYSANQPMGKLQKANVPELAKDEASQDYKLYDNLFFNPMQQGFNDLNSIIRNQLFGTLDELKGKFGIIGASIIQALQAVIAKLIETAIIAGVLSLITGGNFGAIFSFLGSGGTGGEVMKAMGGGRTSINTGKIANQMATSGGGNRGITVNVVGKLGNDAIYLSGNRYLAMQNASKI